MVAGTTTGDNLLFNAATSFYHFDGCVLTAGDKLELGGGAAEFIDCVFDLGVSPNIAQSVSEGSYHRFRGCDFSANTAGDTIVSPSTTAGGWIEFANCDMPTTWTGSQIDHGTYGGTQFYNCDDSSDYPRTESYQRHGTVKTDTGVYITTGGWSDETANSTGTPLSHIMEPDTTVDVGMTLNSFPIVAYIDSTGSKTFTVECIDDFETTLQDDEVWLEIAYHATSGQVQHSLGTSRVLLGDTPANLTAGVGTGSWTGEPASSRSVRLAVTVTVNNIGLYEATVVLGKYEANGADTNPGAAFYVAPLITIS
jgi:hypothetical protein